MLINFDGDHREDFMMADEDVFESYPRLLDPDFSQKKLEMGKFADILSQRSLSTSTPCVRRSVSNSSSKTVENDSGYVDSFMDSLCSSETQLLHINTDHDDSKMETTIETVSHKTRLLPKIDVNLYSDPLSSPSDWDIGYITPDISRQIVQPPIYRVLKNYSKYPSIEEKDVSFEESSVIDTDTHNSSLNASGLTDRFAKVLRHFSPPEPDRVIGRKMLLDHVDIIGELDCRNLNFSCTSIILGYLDAQDLCRMCQVSRQWKQVCHNDQVSSKRMRQFINRHKSGKQAGKENYVNRKSVRQSRDLRMPGSSPLKTVQLLGSLRRSVTDDLMSTPCVNSVAKRDLFDQAAKSLQNDESLCLCPKCQSPARKDPTQQRARCFNGPCSFDFCVKCQCEFHAASPCLPGSVKKSKPDSIGSRKSKKNLQRLLRRV